MSSRRGSPEVQPTADGFRMAIPGRRSLDYEIVIAYVASSVFVAWLGYRAGLIGGEESLVAFFLVLVGLPVVFGALQQQRFVTNTIVVEIKAFEVVIGGQSVHASAIRGCIRDMTDIVVLISDASAGHISVPYLYEHKESVDVLVAQILEVKSRWESRAGAAPPEIERLRSAPPRERA